MPRKVTVVLAVNFFIALAMVYSTSTLAQQAGPEAAGKAGKKGAKVLRPQLFFREEWKIAPGAGEHPVNADAVSNPNLELKLYGTSGKQIQETGTPGDENDPVHMWSGLCETPCALALRDKSNYVDLTGLARIRWVTKVSGFHKVHPIIKLADGTWLVGDYADGSVTDWHETEFSVADVRWLRLDIDKVWTRGTIVEKPDLSKVDEIGFTDLMPGSGHGQGGWSDVGKVEVYGKAVKRDSGGAGQ
ncbi:MAG: hypothetical protein C5B51_00090 [Terriglobia bacterium]|nr:MAG: hypothetical protein C5B51_00090 [Terriglobia bacterium]